MRLRPIDPFSLALLVINALLCILCSIGCYQDFSYAAASGSIICAVAATLLFISILVRNGRP